MASSVSVWIEDELLVPPGIDSLDAFRLWLYSEAFPERGRIDYLQGAIEVDMSPEELQTHAIPKVDLAFFINRVVREGNLGQVFVDRTRLGSDLADLNCEPDVLYVSWEALRSGRVRYLPGSPASPERLMEVHGGADLAVEVVSRGSVSKDTRRLPPLYAKAGVLELWLADARRAELRFQIFHLHEDAYVEALPDAEGYRLSRVLGRRLRLRRELGPVPATWIYTVEDQPV